MLPGIGGEDLSPQELKIIELEKNIQEILEDVQRAQQIWIRKESFMISLSQQRDSQLRELSLLNKEITIMEQKNLKLEYALEKLDRDQANMSSTVHLLEQKSQRINNDLVLRKVLRENLEGKNYIMKSECIVSFQDLELDLIKIQGELKDFHDKKVILKEELHTAHQEVLSWEKKIHLMQQTAKGFKAAGGADGVGTMRNEIHKMEMRLSHLKRIQEKLIHDMQFCIARRVIIVDKVIGKIKQNPKERHNRKVVRHKRLANQRMKIKFLVKSIKETDSRVQKTVEKIRTARENFSECGGFLMSLEGDIPEMEREITQLEIIKCHNLQSLVLKQRKANLLRDIKNRKYKTLWKNETTIEAELVREQACRQYLEHVMEKTGQDFPLLNMGIRKVQFGLEILKNSWC